MGPAETTGIVIIVVSVLQGLFKLIEHILNKHSAKNEISNDKLLDAIVNKTCGMSSRQSEQLSKLYDLHDITDTDGTPLWYVPRSWAETQKEIVKELRGIAETQYKTLSLIERLEKKKEE